MQGPCSGPGRDFTGPLIAGPLEPEHGSQPMWHRLGSYVGPRVATVLSALLSGRNDESHDVTFRDAREVLTVARYTVSLCSPFKVQANVPVACVPSSAAEATTLRWQSRTQRARAAAVRV
ncbi:hypothetical protein PYCCODRAFT_823437 [Trametes coccinea BRFM310]|uniref:Uncharacterized protein n=1 Tax=Trametes coccinea (strain BRFM310) TaxID=1353009 RepID=A0A1Y2IAM3_TRAC3|nr:hypothetical protein PYCCODRAFT_1036366 [Trametes coccinea BRFM310]OSC99649.1 hypothetical protein PYCCODRAFT_823437 [Trametes coccinea BRFM310]